MTTLEERDAAWGEAMACRRRQEAAERRANVARAEAEEAERDAYMAFVRAHDGDGAARLAGQARGLAWRAAERADWYRTLAGPTR